MHKPAHLIKFYKTKYTHTHMQMNESETGYPNEIGGFYKCLYLRCDIVLYFYRILSLGKLKCTCDLSISFMCMWLYNDLN